VDYRAAIERAAAEVNERFSRPGWMPVSLVVRDDFLESIAAYLEYDVLLVNPVMDGLNLVAKEAPLVNRRDGVLVLSREAGAFEELGEWVVPVDPLDVEGQAAALERAIGLPAEVRRSWLDSIRRLVRTHDVDAWADRELAELDARAPREDAGATMRA
jgi:trehalose 6-phosphate synthase